MAFSIRRTFIQLCDIGFDISYYIFTEENTTTTWILPPFSFRSTVSVCLVYGGIVKLIPNPCFVDKNKQISFLTLTRIIIRK